MEPGRLSGFRDWIVWMEKFGQPTPIASYSEETDEESKNVAAKIIRAVDGPGRVRIAATALGSQNRATRSDARILGQTFAIGHGIQRTPAGSSHVPERLAERRRQTGFGASLSGHRPGGVLPWLVRGIERAVAYPRTAKARTRPGPRSSRATGSSPPDRSGPDVEVDPGSIVALMPSGTGHPLKQSFEP